MPDLPIVLYEGEEDKAFLEALFETLEIKSKFLLHPECGGNGHFRKILTGLVARDYQIIVVVADNDGDPTTAFTTIRRQIREAGYTVPECPRQTVTTPNQSPLSVLMIPWDNDPGCLETLCLTAPNPLYKDQLRCADDLVKCAGASNWNIAKQSKLRMRAFLSTVCQSDPNTGLRYAWKTTNGRPGDIFPLKSGGPYDQIAKYFTDLAQQAE